MKPITRISYTTKKSPRTVLGKLELVALFVGIVGFDYDPEDQLWFLQIGNGHGFQGEFDEVIKMAYDDVKSDSSLP